MKVLVVDDNSANRMTLRWMISKADVESIEEAESGHEAVEACKRQYFDLIFMDVMMPGMTGVEATEEIRKISPSSMVISVTALDDDETAKDMFRVGAEDYLTKPIKQDIFKARLHTYIKIIENRKFYSLSTSSVNLFNKPIFNLLKIFKVKDESNLAEVWEHFLHSLGDLRNEKLCDTISKIYSVGTLLLKMDRKFSIFCEEDETTLYFTLNKTSILNKHAIEDLIKKDDFVGEHLVGNDRVSFAVIKGAYDSSYHEPVQKHVPATEGQFIDENAKEHSIKKGTETSSAETENEMGHMDVASHDELFIFNFMDEHDMIDMEEYLKELDRYLLLMQNQKLEEIDALNIAHKIDRISSIMALYHEMFELGIAMKSLSYDIQEYVGDFILHSQALSVIFASFTKDLLDWYVRLFKKGAPSVNFLDATIITNSIMVSSVIKPSEETHDNSSLDDIFF